MKLYQRIAARIEAMYNCRRTGNTEWYNRHKASVENLVKNFLPSGSGFDAGTMINLTRSSWNRLVFHTDFHHMNQNGTYDGWTDHEVVVTPDLASDFNVRVTGRDRDQIKDYINVCFNEALDTEVEEPIKLVVDNTTKE